MKRLSNLIRTALILLLITAMTAACTSGQGGTASPDESTGDANAPQTNGGETGASEPTEGEEQTGHLITEEPLELTIHMHYGNSFVFQDDWPVFQEAAKLTNISLKGTAPSSASNSVELFNVTIASGDLPDIVHSNQKPIYDTYGMEGAFEPLNDLIDQYAPNIKAFYEEHPEVKQFATAPDGNIYFITIVLDGAVAKGWFIRQDWLDQLNLDVPTTVDEMYNVMKAFREQDPNGNGEKDEVPFFARLASAPLDFLVFWNANRGLYLEDGNIGYGPYEDAYQTGIENIAKWYQEGLIDQEIFTRGTQGRDIMLRENRGGITNDWLGSTAEYNDIVKETVAEFAFLPMLPPASVDGKIRVETRRNKLGSSGWGIASTSEHKIEAIKYFDFWFSEEGRRLMNFGIEGVHYDMVDGKPQFKEEILNAEQGTLAKLQEDGAQIEIGFHQDFEYERQWSNEIALQAEDMYVKADAFMEQYPTLSYTEEEKDRRDRINGAISTYVEEMSQKWILGAEPLTDAGFASFRQSLKDMGVEELLQIEQAAYDRYMSN